MSATRPALLPLLRSENQLRLLAALLLAPARRYTIGELAEHTGIPQPSVSREVANLLETSVLSASVEHRRKVVRANIESPIFPELASLLLKTVGPKVMLERSLEGARGVVNAYIYGSWARRYAGELGSEPNDIDLLIVGSPDVHDVRRRAERASERLGRDVNVSVLSPDEWSSTGSVFVDHIRNSPLVTLDLTEDAHPQDPPAAP